jgi:predicted PurR-regulated permease PerM
MTSKNQKRIDEKLKSLYSIFLNTSEIISRNSEEVDLSDYEQALLTLIASIITSEGKIDESELKLASVFFRNNSPVDRANKLLSQLELMIQNKDNLSIENAAKVFREKLDKGDILNLFNALIQYAVDHKIDPKKEETLIQIGEALGFIKPDINILIKTKKNIAEKSQRYGKIGGIAFVIIFLAGIILLAGFLRPIFLGLAFAYLMDPVLTFFEKKTRFSRNHICIASIVIFILVITLVGIKLISSINIADIKELAIKAPSQLENGLEKFEKVLKEKNVPPQIIEQIDQGLYGSVYFTNEELSKSSDLEKKDEIASIIDKKILNETTLLTIFPEYEKTFKLNPSNIDSLITILNTIIDSSDLRIKLINSTQNYDWQNIENKEKISKYINLEDIHQKILIRNMFSELYQLPKLITTNEKLTKYIKELLLSDATNYSSFFGGVFGKLKWFIGIIIDIVLAIGFYYFFARKFYQIGTGILETVPAAYRYNTDQIFRKINWILEGYMRGQFLLILIEASFYSIIFYLVGIKYFYILGLISGVAVLVPYLGILTAFSLTLTAAIAGGMNIFTAVIFLILLYGSVNLIENLFLSPKLVGDRVGLSDLETLIAIVAGGSLGGIIGVVLAIPIAAILKVFLIMLYEWYKESAFYKQDFPLEEHEIDIKPK